MLFNNHKRSKTIVLGLVLSLSVAVLGSAFAPSNRPSLAGPNRRSLASNRNRASYTKLPENNKGDSNERQDQKAEEKAIASDALRGGGTSTLPAAMPPLPTLQDFQRFALPCLALWVSGPLLSLVDTSFIGLSGSASESAKQLAALGPATTFFDGATYLFAFLNVATTNLYSSARARRGEHSEEAEGVVRTASRVARNCGIGLTIFLFFFARSLLKIYIGECRYRNAVGEFGYCFTVVLYAFCFYFVGIK
mgnify:CR=1 FL=1